MRIHSYLCAIALHACSVQERHVAQALPFTLHTNTVASVVFSSHELAAYVVCSCDVVLKSQFVNLRKIDSIPRLYFFQFLSVR